MRIRKMTVVLPARLRHVAEQEARRIGHAAAEQLADGAPSALQVNVDGNGASGHGLTASVARALAQHRKGTH